jgi:hypothetical protein
MLVVVLKDCVTETNETSCLSNNSTSLAKLRNGTAGKLLLTHRF